MDRGPCGLGMDTDKGAKKWECSEQAARRAVYFPLAGFKAQVLIS